MIVAVVGATILVGLAGWLIYQRRRRRADARIRWQALALAAALKERLRFAERARTGGLAEQEAWRTWSAAQSPFSTGRFEAAGDAGVSGHLGEPFEAALALFAELDMIVTLTARGEGYVTLAQAAGRYVACGSKLYAFLAEIAGIGSDWAQAPGCLADHSA